MSSGNEDPSAQADRLRTVRGGEWVEDGYDLRSHVNWWGQPRTRHTGFGFRLALRRSRVVADPDGKKDHE